MKTRGFIGLGIMGFPMAGHISKKYPTLVFNRSVAKAENWVKTYKGAFQHLYNNIQHLGGNNCFVSYS